MAGGVRARHGGSILVRVCITAVLVIANALIFAKATLARVTERVLITSEEIQP